MWHWTLQVPSRLFLDNHGIYFSKMQILRVLYYAAGWLVYRRNVAGFATAICKTQYHQPSGKNMSTLKILRIPTDPRWACKVHFLLPVLSLLSGIKVCEVKIVHKKTKCFLFSIVSVPHFLHVEMKFVLNIQWRISRWKRVQSPTLLNICSISQLSEPNQTTEEIIQEIECQMTRQNPQSTGTMRQNPHFWVNHVEDHWNHRAQMYDTSYR